MLALDKNIVTAYDTPMVKASTKPDKRPRGRPPNEYRNSQIVAHYEQTRSLRKTAEAFKVSWQRVSQIVAARKP